MFSMAAEDTFNVENLNIDENEEGQHHLNNQRTLLLAQQ